MNRQLRTALLPGWTSEFPAEEPGGVVAVMIDILRASTTIVTALSQGATGVVPFLEVSEARQWKANHPEGLLGGERGGLKIDGFDLGNSPTDYGPETVQGREIGFTTTNGTRALMAVESAETVLIGAFVNARAVLERLRGASRVLLVCAGTNGQVTREDVLFAGCLADGLIGQADWEADDSSQIAAASWREVAGTEMPRPAALEAALAATQGGRNLRRLGLADDLACVARLDAWEAVPTWDRETRRICIP
ncbi:MAG: 2-phosphosulfolactate phosphatase [Planctomycetales bacterium]|nr:2-phosphosulfolactate phosphatase [Planctomycetales bacterium]